MFNKCFLSPFYSKPHGGIYVILNFWCTSFSLSKVKCYGREDSDSSDTWFIFQKVDGKNEIVSLVFMFTLGVMVIDGFG